MEHLKIFEIETCFNPFKCFKQQPHKMVKHTQTFRWQQTTNCFGVFNTIL